MGLIVIVGYKPLAGKEAELLQLTKDHVPILRAQGLATKRKVTAMRAKDGTIIEVFEWKSAEAIIEAHKNPAVLEMWGRYSKACEIVKLNQLPESSDMFASFEPIEL
jgi:hypothetical protein